MKRTVYFIYDTIKKGYCCDTHGATGDFAKATIYLSQPNALKSIKDREFGVKQVLGWGKPTRKDPSYEYALEEYNLAVRRNKIPNGGFEVVPVELNDAR